MAGRQGELSPKYADARVMQHALRDPAYMSRSEGTSTDTPWDLTTTVMLGSQVGRV